MALSIRLPNAVTSWLSLPRTEQPVSPPVTTSIWPAAAASPVRSTASRTTRSTATDRGSGSGSAPCSRDRSISSCTSRPRRSASWRIRPAKRRTAAGSSQASEIASASRDSAPTGVLSSWLTLATKSRRAASTRPASVMSSTRTSTSPPRGSRVNRTLTAAGSRLMRSLGRSSSTSRGRPSRRTAPTSRRNGATVIRPARTMPMACAVGLASNTSAEGSTTTAPMCRLSTTVSASIAWRATGSIEPCGSGTSGPARGQQLRQDRASHARATSSPPASRPALVDMTNLVGSAMNRATTALLDGDLALAESVISHDEAIDQLYREIEERSLELLARQQPVAGDLRVLITGLRMVADLERMGDLAVHVAKVARRRYPQSAIPAELRATMLEMGQVAQRIVTKAGSVIASRDLDMAAELEKDDDVMDSLHRQVFAELLDGEWQHGMECAIDVTLVGRYFERFADHAVSVTRRVVFIVTGQRLEPATASAVSSA